MLNAKVYRASILHFLSDPEDYQYFDDGMLVVQSGKVMQVGAAKDVKKQLAADVEVVDYSGYLITPGFIDAHIHYPQTEIIASYGGRLLDWLNTYTFPAEQKYSDKAYAHQEANFFLQELLRNGVTTAAVYGTVHAASVDAFFEAAQQYNVRMLAGKVLMDRNAPEYLLDTATSAYEDSKRLIEKWHNKHRFSYVVTPRFAPTSTETELEAVAELMKEYPDVYMQTHIAENKKEAQWIKDIYPWAKHYTAVYDHFGLLGPRSLFGHAIYLSDEEFQRFNDTQSVMVWCPTSNFFLGSGLFDLGRARKFQNRVAIGSDVGAGSSFSPFRTLNEAYKVSVSDSFSLKPLDGWYAITLGNAKALSLEDKIGNFEAGKEADFVVLNPNATPLLNHRLAFAKTLEERLFVLSMLGDDRLVKATYVYGACVSR